MKKQTKWEDFIKKIKLYKVKQEDDVKFIGVYVSGKKLIDASLTMKQSTLELNSEDINYINVFIKEKLAKDIASQINEGAYNVLYS